jgi:hypothetical protein
LTTLEDKGDYIWLQTIDNFCHNVVNEDVLREDWGTLTFKFTSKDTGSVVRDSTMGFGTTTVDFVRLTYVTGLTCP